MPLPLRLQAQQAELHDARMQAQQAAGVSAARHREMERAQHAAVSSQFQLRSLQAELVTARAAASEASADAQEARIMQASSHAAMLGAQALEGEAMEAAAVHRTKALAAQGQLSVLQEELFDSESRVAAAYSKLDAQPESQHWQAQLQRAEMHLRTLSGQLREKVPPHPASLRWPPSRPPAHHTTRTDDPFLPPASAPRTRARAHAPRTAHARMHRSHAKTRARPHAHAKKPSPDHPPAHPPSADRAPHAHAPHRP